MLQQMPTAERLKRLNRRQRKKLRVGEFQELVFVVRVAFRRALDELAYAPLLDAFIDLIESRRLMVGGMGGRLPLLETDGVVSASGRGSPSEDDRQVILNWLTNRPEVASAESGELVDGWYGWASRPQ